MSGDTDNSSPRPDRCGTCKFWEAGDDQAGADFGECRRNPPPAGVISDGDLIGLFPVTDPDSWCGKWKPLDRAQVVRRPPLPGVSEVPGRGAGGAD